MNLVLLLPLGLAALAAWLVPLLIHLRRRSEQHRTDFAALRWLAARARPRSRLRFEEWPLLLVRLLLLAALALLLAHPVLFGGPHAKRWIVVAAGVDRADVPTRIAGVEQRWLAPGFPTLDEAMPQTTQPLGSLLRELDASLPADTQLTVLVPTQLDGADAVRPSLHRTVEWQAVPERGDNAKPARQQPAPRPLLAVRHAGDHEEPVRYLRAAAIAWQVASAPAPHNASTAARDANKASSDIASIERSLPAINLPLVWLSPGPLPASLRTWLDKGGIALVGADSDVPAMARDGTVLWRDDQGEVVVRGMAHGHGRLMQLTRPLAPDAMPILLDGAFPEQLWTLFAPAPPPPTRIAASNYAPRTGGHAWPEQPRDLQPWLLWLIAGLFVLERWMASGRREVTAP